VSICNYSRILLRPSFKTNPVTGVENVGLKARECDGIARVADTGRALSQSLG
jgi:hypothetical protein